MIINFRFNITFLQDSPNSKLHAAILNLFQLFVHFQHRAIIPDHMCTCILTQHYIRVHVPMDCCVAVHSLLIPYLPRDIPIVTS